jgi:uncharacterized DUF497 family protein
VKITYDPQKRADTLSNRAPDFEDVAEVFAGNVYETEDNRQDYGEIRWLTVGFLNGRLVMVVWTARGDARHVISMRKCNEREKRKYFGDLGRSG